MCWLEEYDASFYLERAGYVGGVLRLAAIGWSW
jgi:hypothetical protein